MGPPGSIAASQPLPPPHGPPHPASPPPGAHPLAAGAVAPGGGQSIWSTRLLDLLNLVRHEFDVIGNDAVHFKSQRDEMEHRGRSKEFAYPTVAQQFNEVGLMQDHVYELEKRHFEIVAQYEDEIKRLRALLDARGIAGAQDAPGALSAPPSMPPRPAGSSSRGSSPNRSYPRHDRGAHPDALAPLPPRASQAPEGGPWPPSKRAKTNGAYATPPSGDLRSRFKREEREGKRPGTLIG